MVVAEELAALRVGDVKPSLAPDAPIGIFDSGFGGLSVYREVRQMLPTEDVIYVADGAYVPYGLRTPLEIVERSDRITQYLIGQGVKLVIVACNTASAYAIDILRERYPQIRFIGLEPAVKPAVGQTSTGHVGVLATPRTVSGERLHRLIDRWANGVTVTSVAGEGMVELVEAGKLSGPEVDAVIRPLLDQLLDAHCDVIVLGCTHYPFLRKSIVEYVGPEVRVIDSGVAIARRALSVLQSTGVQRERGDAGALRLMTTAPPEETSRVATALLGRQITASQIIA